MASFSKQVLSGSPSASGKGIEVTATTMSASATLIHTAHATALDEIWLYAANQTSTSQTLTIGWGYSSDVADTIDIVIPGDAGLILVVPGLILTGGNTVRASATNAPDDITIFGYVNRIT